MTENTALGLSVSGNAVTQGVLISSAYFTGSLLRASIVIYTSCCMMHSLNILKRNWRQQECSLKENFENLIGSKEFKETILWENDTKRSFISKTCAQHWVESKIFLPMLRSKASDFEFLYVWQEERKHSVSINKLMNFFFFFIFGGVAMLA